MVLSICLSTLYAVLFVVGFFGNLLTALIIIFNSYMRVPPNFFLLSLAVADMITLLGGKKLNIFDSVQANRIVHFKTFKLRPFDLLFPNDIVVSVLKSKQISTF